MWEDLKELYRFRALIKALVTRHLAVRYRGSVLGFLWSFLNPLCLMLVYTLVFQYYIRFDNVGNYTIFLFCGLLPWIWLSSGLIESTNSIVSSGHLITKSMFPAHVLPVVTVLTTLVNFVLSLPLLFIFMLIAGLEFHWTIALLPLVVIGQVLLLLGFSLMLSALNVFYRDVQHIVANLLTFVFFLCPILYPRSQVPEGLQFTLDYNPLAQLTMFYQAILLDGVLPSLFGVVYFCLFAGALLWIGNRVFHQYRETFAELL